MIHARKDYNRIQDPAMNDPLLLSPGSTPIGEDEPVFLVRAHDQAFIVTLEEWCDAHLAAGGDFSMVDAVRAHIGRAIAWREKHGTKVADAPSDALATSRVN